jgi:soluble lytic murein transglycosylase
VGELQLRDAWVNHGFTLAEEQRFLARYAGKLKPEDHAQRVDRLLWAREVTAARRTFSRLTSRDRRMAEARAALLMRAASGPALFEALPDEERMDSGVLLAAVRYYRRAEEEPRAVALARLAPATPQALRNPQRWWEERQLLMRWALTEKQYADAYAMAAGHGLDPGTEFSEAEFNAGWIALRYLNAPERAEAHFKALAASVTAPISVARAYYWLGRAAEARGERDRAQIRYARAANYIYTFYGQLAAEKIGAPTQVFAAPIAPTAEESARFSARPVVAALRILSDLGADKDFLTFAYQVDDELESAGEYVELARLADRLGATHVAVRAGKVGIGRGAFAAEVAYPLVYVPDEAARFVPAEIILGLSRQESEFNPRAFSSAGARGLMQLIPSTAQITAKKERLRYNRSALLDDPVYNMIIGSAHLSHLFEKYDDSRIMTYVAYNAGANRVDQWIERYGDPRSEGVDPVDWIEQIPFAETRNYVQRVLENTQVYRSRLANTPIAGQLAVDLERGGPSKRAGLMPARNHIAALPPLPERTAKFASAAPADDPGVHTAPAAPPVATGVAEAGGGGSGVAGGLKQEISLDADDLAEAEEASFVADERAPVAPSRKPQPSRIIRVDAARAIIPPGARAPDDNSAAALNAASSVRTLGAEEAPALPSDILAIDGEPPAAAEPPADTAPEPVASAVADRCAYVAFLRESAKTAEDVARINAAMAVELEGGGSGC